MYVKESCLQINVKEVNYKMTQLRMHCNLKPPDVAQSFGFRQFCTV